MAAASDQDVWSLVVCTAMFIARQTHPILNFKIEQQFSHSYQEATLDIHVQVHTQQAQLCVEAAFSADECCVVTDVLSKPVLNRAPLQLVVSSPQLWSDESPYLYQLVLHLTDKVGRHWVCCAIGLRSVEMRQGQICLNGKPILFRGVNRHELHPERCSSFEKICYLISNYLNKATSTPCVQHTTERPRLVRALR